MQKKQLIEACIQCFSILDSYYSFESTPDFESYLLPLDEAFKNGGRVLYQEDSEKEEIYLGLQFGQDLHTSFSSGNSPSKNDIAIVAEETSHLQMLFDAFEQSSQVTIFDLEVQGEVDRFLALIHWHARFQRKLEWKNLHELCDYVFSGERFQAGAAPLYIEAEARALTHLQRAFSHCWDNSYFNFNETDKKAKAYLKDLRQSFFRNKKTQRIKWPQSA